MADKFGGIPVQKAAETIKKAAGYVSEPPRIDAFGGKQAPKKEESSLFNADAIASKYDNLPSPDPNKAVLELLRTGRLEAEDSVRVRAAISNRQIKPEEYGYLHKGGPVVKGLNEGVRRRLAGLKQLGMQAVESIKGAPQGALLSAEGDPYAGSREFTQAEQAKRQEFDESDIGQEAATKVSRFAGEIGLDLAIPMKGTGTLGRRAVEGGAVGLGIAGTQFVPEGGSRLEQAVAGGAGGVLIPGVTTLGGRGLDIAKGATGRAADQLRAKVGPTTAKRFVGEEVTPDMERRLADAEVLDVQITPAEASGNIVLGKRQGALGHTEEGAEALVKFGEKRLAQEKSSVNNLLDTISDPSKLGAAGVKEAVSKTLTKKQKVLSRAARPFYRKAYVERVDGAAYKELTSNPVVKEAIARIKKDPIYARDLKGLPDDSVGMLDIAKQDIYRAAQKEKTDVGYKTTRREQNLMDAYGNIRDTLSNTSENYRAAINLYRPEASALENLSKSKFGALAKIDDKNLKTISRTVFDRQETNINEFKHIRDMIQIEDPKAWRRITREEMQRRLRTQDAEDLATGAADTGASTFFRKIMKDSDDFRMFEAALENNPKALEKFRAMRNVFQHLGKPESVPSSVFRSKSFLDSPRNTAAQVALRSGKYDKAVVEFITDPKWNKQFNEIINKANKERPALIGGMLAKIQASLQESQPDKE